MKVFRVVTERDGKTTNDQGKISTKVVHKEYRYAANLIKQAWEASMNLPDDEHVIAIHEEHPAITILQ